MRSFRWSFLAIFLVVVGAGLALQASACTWAAGYFYQVTALRGRVVGAHLGFLQEIGPLRRAFLRKHAKLTLCTYRWPIHVGTHQPVVKAVETDDHGRFDFGLIPAGHYRLFIDNGQKFSGEFDVEVRTLPRPTAEVTIDVSPVFPDCSGGHTFLVRTK